MSMSIFAYQNGQANGSATVLTTTNSTDVVPASDNSQFAVMVCVSNTTAGTVTVTLESFDGTTARSIITGLTLAAAGTVASIYLFESPIFLDKNWSLRAKAGTANALHVHATYIQAWGRTV